MKATATTARRRRGWRVLRRAGADEGQSLVLVLMVSVLTMLLVSTATTALTTQIRPAKASLDSGAALAAAESGLEDFIAQVNQNCIIVLGCTWLGSNPTRSNPASPVNVLTTAGKPVAGALGGTPGEWFQWQIMALDNASGKVRVKSTGQVPLGGGTGKFRTKTLIADIMGTPGFPDFQYYTTFETYSSDYLTNLYADRYINVTLASNNNDFQDSQITSRGPGLLHWTGSSAGGVSMTDQTKICEDLYQGSPTTGPGRSAAGGYPQNPAYFAGSDFAWFNEDGSWQPTSGATQDVTHTDACDVAFEAGMVMNGPIYTQDSYLLDSFHSSNGACSSNTNQNPTFNAASVAGRTDLAYSLFQGTPATLQANGNYFRTYASYGESSSNGGVPATSDAGNLGCMKFPQRTTQAVALPDTTAKAKGHGPCIYTGPTRIQIKNQTAYVTSPLTPAVPGSHCYNSDPSYVNNNGVNGVVHAAVPIDHTILYVQNPPATTPSAATAANRVFDVRTNVTAPALSSTDSLAGTWTGTYSASTPCPLTPVDATKQRNFDCETGANANPAKENVFSNIKAAVDTALQNPAGPAAAFATSLQTLIKSKMGGATLVTTAPTSLNNGQIRYLVTVTPGTATNVNTPAPSFTASDPFLQPTNGTGYTTTTQPWNVTITRYSCTTPSNCTGTGGHPNPTATVMVSNKPVSQSTSSTPVNSTGKFPWFGTGQTDAANDITQYSNGYGDAYVEGTVQGNLSVVAEHDLLLTNTVNYANTNPATTTDGAAYVAGHDVRIYRPLSCVSADPVGAVHPTTPGWCPNDISGADTSPSPKWSSTYPPSQQYKNSSAPSILTSCGGACTKNSTTSIYGLFFSLGSRNAAGARTGGSFMVDNVARGNDNGSLNLTGGLYQYHRGITKLQWKDNPGGSNIERPGMSLTFNYDNMRAGQAPNGGSRVPWVPTPAGKAGTRTWNVVSISTGT